jgi:hypothetical protein
MPRLFDDPATLPSQASLSRSLLLHASSKQASISLN